MSDDQSPLSTSALARALGKTTKQMFAELEALAWINREGDSWQLTAKGEFEGGKFRESHKFGRYIIWPVEVKNHQALVSPDNQLLSVTLLAKHLSLGKRFLERMLAELGWQRPQRKGWVLTQQGEQQGGCQREYQNSAVPYVLWPEDLLENPALADRVDRLQQAKEAQGFVCCDGHVCDSGAERDIDNWLYFYGLVHAYKYKLPQDSSLTADFYLPQYQLYIEYCGDQARQTLAWRMKKRELLRLNNDRVIELTDTDIKQLDETLPPLLLKYDIEV